MSYSTMYNNKNIIFIHIPKCAGMSVRHWYNETFDNVDIKNHAPLSYYNLQNSIPWTIIRNPYDRAVSWYKFRGQIINRRKHKRKEYLEEIPYWQKGINYWINYYFDVYWYDHKHGNKMLGPDNSYFKLSTPQVAWFKSNDQLSSDIIKVKLENFKNEIIDVEETINLKIDLDKKNRSERQDNIFLDSNTKKLIEKFYKDDFEHLGY